MGIFSMHCHSNHDNFYLKRMKEISMATAPLKHVYLVDGSGFIFRAFHGLPLMTRPDGTPVNAVLGFTNMLMKLLTETDVDHLAVIFDSARRNFRHDIYPNYKANRPPPPPELIPQFPLIREACDAFSVPSIELIGYEADDLIASYTHAVIEQGADVTIVSSDKDLMQLIGPRVRMFDPMKNKFIGDAEVELKFGVKPEQIIDVQALAGDSSDNIPGVPGIGIKTAMQLIQEFGSLQELLGRLHEIPQTKRRETLEQNIKKLFFRINSLPFQRKRLSPYLLKA
jgi:DNA polymerase-1